MIKIMIETKKSDDETASLKEVKLPCGCVYQDKGWMLNQNK